jgi:hypothetical protein
MGTLPPQSLIIVPCSRESRRLAFLISSQATVSLYRLWGEIAIFP